MPWQQLSWLSLFMRQYFISSMVFILGCRVRKAMARSSVWQVSGPMNMYPSFLQTYWVMGMLQLATYPFCSNQEVISILALTVKPSSNTTTAWLPFQRAEGSTMNHWLLWVPLREVLKQPIHQSGVWERWLATTVRIQEGAVDILRSSQLAFTQFCRLVSKTPRPELKRMKSSLEMRSPGREVKLVVCMGTPSLGKLHVLKMRRVSVKGSWVWCEQYSIFPQRRMQMSQFFLSEISPVSREIRSSRSPAEVRQQNCWNSNFIQGRRSLLILARYPACMYLTCARQCPMQVQKGSSRLISAIRSMQLTCCSRKFSMTGGALGLPRKSILIRLLKAFHIQRQVAQPSRKPAAWCCWRGEALALVQMQSLFHPVFCSRFSQVAWASSSATTFPLTQNSLLSEQSSHPAKATHKTTINIFMPFIIIVWLFKPNKDLEVI